MPAASSVWQQTASSTGGGPGEVELTSLILGQGAKLGPSYFLSMRCSLPRKQSGWASAVTSFIVVTTP